MTIPQEIQDLMPKRKRNAWPIKTNRFELFDAEINGFNQALQEVEAVLPQMLALAEKRGAEG